MEKCIASKLTLELKFLKNLKQKLNELGNNEYFIENWIKIKNKKRQSLKKKLNENGIPNLKCCFRRPVIFFFWLTWNQF